MESRRREALSIGQDLHDGICQQLAGIEFRLQAVAENTPSKSQAAEVSLIAARVRDAIAQTRSLAHGLVPVVLESEGLMSALAKLAEDISQAFGVRCQFKNETPVHVHNNAAATHLYRIAQEAVANAIKHGKAKSIKIRLAAEPKGIVLTIQDNGAGLPPNSAASKGMGLHIMKYRADMIGAQVAIQTQSSGGTAVVCSLPQTAASNRK